MAGNLIERGNILEIDEVFTVHGDVDNSTGNLDFVGSIVVKGDVKGGFKLKARGNIDVRGMVENSYLSAGGDVTLNGMNGRDEGKIEAGGNIKASFVENAILVAKNDINADSMMYCKITCGGNLTLSGKRGCLIGGTAIVVNNVTAKAIGTITHTATELILGTASLLIGEREKLTAQIKECDDDILKLIQVVTYLKSKPIETLSPDRVKMLQQASFNIQIYNNKKIELQARVAEIEAELKKPNLSTVTCKGTIFTGTKITMNNASVRITEDRDATLLYLDGSEIAFGLA